MRRSAHLRHASALAASRRHSRGRPGDEPGVAEPAGAPDARTSLPIAAAHPTDRRPDARRRAAAPRAVSRRRGRLHVLPPARGRRTLGRRTRPEYAVRHDLLLQHHAGQGNRHRRLDARPVLPRHARRHRRRRQEPLSRLSLSVVQAGQPRGRRCHLRLSEDHAGGAATRRRQNELPFPLNIRSW